MFRILSSANRWIGCFPRVRGDVPEGHQELHFGIGFSPRARGCSSYSGGAVRGLGVFPACAGMFRNKHCCVWRRPCFPRVRGDVPHTPPRGIPIFSFSPRARGCSGNGGFAAVVPQVFPACAGMFLAEKGDMESAQGFPRVRGDVPHHRVRHHGRPPVFPACAGMFRKCGAMLSKASSFPRVRGDVPPR